MIFNMVGGGASNPFAMVLVNYPQNSTLTATNVDGFKDISHSSSANPQRLYYVSQPSGSTQECQFTIEDTSTTPTRQKTQTVSGIALASAQTITLDYNNWLYYYGNESTILTGGWVDGNRTGNPSSGASTFAKESDALLLTRKSISEYANNLSALTNNTIAFNRTYSTAKAKVIITNVLCQCYITIVSNKTSSFNTIAYGEPATQLNVEQILTCDISNVSGNYYFGIRATGNPNDGTSYVRIKEVWLE